MTTINETRKDIGIQINGVTIYYDDLGTGDTPIIFIHGFPFNKSMWEPQMQYFNKTQRVIAYDVRGFGKSTMGDIRESMDLFADDLIKFMNVLGIRKAIVCGFSMGGYILLNAVNRYPERFEAIILSDTQCIADTPKNIEKRNQAISQIIAGRLNDFADAFVKSVFCINTINSKMELVNRARNIILSTSPVAITGTLSALAERVEMCTSLNKINIPTLLLFGKEDILTPPIQAEFLHANISNSSLYYIDKAAHMSNLERPDEYNRHISFFISGLNC